MKPLSERDENLGYNGEYKKKGRVCRNEATLWKRWEHLLQNFIKINNSETVGMKPLSERDENSVACNIAWLILNASRNEATLWKRWEPLLSSLKYNPRRPK